MDEVLRVKSYTVGWKISAHTAARILVILLGMVLAGNPVLRDKTQDFLNAPIIPKAKTEGNASAGGKQEEQVLKPAQIVIRDENELILSGSISNDEVSSDLLLMADAIPEISLQLPHMTDKAENNPTEALAEVVPEVQDVMPDQSMPENVTEMEVPVNDTSEIASDTPAIVKPMIPDVPELGGPAAEKDTIVTEKPADDLLKTEVTVPKEDTIVPGNTEEDSTVSEVIVPDPSGTDPIIPDSVPDNPSVSEPAVPDIGNEGSGSDVTGDVPVDTVGDDSGTEEASCFLLDDVGMLYGFLPEYAEMPDGCLTLPEVCTGIRSGAFLGCGANILELYIPASAVTIEEGALAGLDYLEWIEVDSGNPGCVSDSGVLFDSAMSILLAFPSAWTEGYAVPGSVTRIAGRAFENTSISLLDVRACGILSFGDNVFGNSGGSGIKIITSGENQPVYEELLSGYGVEVSR